MKTAIYTAALAAFMAAMAGCASQGGITQAQCDTMANCTWVKTVKPQYTNCLKENGDRIVFADRPCAYRVIGGYAVVDGKAS